MKHTKRITVVILTMLLMANTLSMSASAAQRGNTPKEEVVYINLNADGSVKEVNIVNIFDLNKKGTIIDYGEYENLRNMTTTDEIHYQNHVVTIDAGAGKLYYEGKLKKNSMPWEIGVKYYMDGREYSADDIAGKSGRLKIKMAIKQNKNCNSVFFDGYALQSTLTFDTDKAANIVADGATVANVGSDKQLVYTILPGKGAEMEISADVTDFEMESINMNGIPLALNIEVDDAELMERITKLQDAVGELDDKMAAYTNMAEQIAPIYPQIYGGARKLKDGTSTLRKETENMDTEIREKIDELLESITGSDTETVSFASADNTNIDAVQFAIKTDAVKIAEQEMAATEPEETSGFWEKLFKLFVW